MPSYTSKKLAFNNLEQFKEAFSEPSPTVGYIFIGNALPYANEASPDSITDTISNEKSVWDNMLAAKRITGNDVRHCIPRFNWSSGVSWNQYEDYWDSKDLKNANTAFYVITDDFNVFKCISNNYGGPSLFKPTSTNPASQFQTADLYIWKFMYSLTSEEQLRFLTPEFMPVKTLLGNEIGRAHV